MNLLDIKDDIFAECEKLGFTDQVTIARQHENSEHLRPNLRKLLELGLKKGYRFNYEWLIALDPPYRIKTKDNVIWLGKSKNEIKMSWESFLNILVKVPEKERDTLYNILQMFAGILKRHNDAEFDDSIWDKIVAEINRMRETL